MGSEYHSLHLKILYKLLIWQKNFSFSRNKEQITDSMFLKIDFIFMKNRGKRFAAWVSTKKIYISYFYILNRGFYGYTYRFENVNALKIMTLLLFWQKFLIKFNFRKTFIVFKKIRLFFVYVMFVQNARFMQKNFRNSFLLSNKVHFRTLNALQRFHDLLCINLFGRKMFFKNL